MQVVAAVKLRAHPRRVLRIPYGLFEIDYRVKRTAPPDPLDSLSAGSPPWRGNRNLPASYSQRGQRSPVRSNPFLVRSRNYLQIAGNNFLGTHGF